MEEISREERQPDQIALVPVSASANHDKAPQPNSNIAIPEKSRNPLLVSRQEKKSPSLTKLLKANKLSLAEEYLRQIIREGRIRSHLLPALKKLEEDANANVHLERIALILADLYSEEGLFYTQSCNGYPLELSSSNLREYYLSSFILFLRQALSLKVSFFGEPMSDRLWYLTQLDLSNNNLSPTPIPLRNFRLSVAQQLAAWLIHPDCHLLSLNISANPGLGGSTELSDGTFLRRLGWGSDIYRILRAIYDGKNTTLKVLNVANTGVNLVDFKYLIPILNDNTTLRAVDISQNPAITFEGRKFLNTVLETRYNRDLPPVNLELAETGLMLPVITQGIIDPVKAFESEMNLQLSILNLRSLGDEMYALYEPETHIPQKWDLYIKFVLYLAFICGGLIAVGTPVGHLIGAIMSVAGVVSSTGFDVVNFIKHLTNLSELLGPGLNELLSTENFKLVIEIIFKGYKKIKETLEKKRHLKELRDKLNSYVHAQQLREMVHAEYHVIAKQFTDHPNLAVNIKRQLVFYYREVIRCLSVEDAIRFASEFGLPLRICLLSGASSSSENLEKLVESFLVRIQVTPFKIFRTVKLRLSVNIEALGDKDDVVPVREDLLLTRLPVLQSRELSSKEVWMCDLIQRSGVVARTADNSLITFDLSKKVPTPAGNEWTQTKCAKFGYQRANKRLLETVNSMVTFYRESGHIWVERKRRNQQLLKISEELLPTVCIAYDNKTYNIKVTNSPEPACFTALGSCRREASQLLVAHLDSIQQMIEPVIVKFLECEASSLFFSFLNPVREVNYCERLNYSFPFDVYQRLKSDVENYYCLLSNNGMLRGYYRWKLRSHAKDKDLQIQIIDYLLNQTLSFDDKGLYPGILLALAKILNIHLFLYKLDESSEMVPSPQCSEFKPDKVARTVEFLYIHNRGYQQLVLQPEKSESAKPRCRWTTDNEVISACGFFKLSLSTLQELERMGELRAIEIQRHKLERMEALEKRVDVLEVKVEEHEKKLQRHSGQLENHEERLKAQEQNRPVVLVIGQESKVTVLERELNNAKTDINSLQEKLLTSNNEVIALTQENKKSLISAQEQIKLLESRVTELSNQRVAGNNNNNLPANFDEQGAAAPPTVNQETEEGNGQENGNQPLDSDGLDDPRSQRGSGNL